MRHASRAYRLLQRAWIRLIEFTARHPWILVIWILAAGFVLAWATR